MEYNKIVVQVKEGIKTIEKSFVAGADIREFPTFNPLKAKSFSEM